MTDDILSQLFDLANRTTVSKAGFIERAKDLLESGASEGQASDARDAARYRWLRSKHGLGGESLDEQIDEAIAKENGE